MICEAKDEIREQVWTMNDHTNTVERATAGGKRSFQQRERDSQKNKKTNGNP